MISQEQAEHLITLVEASRRAARHEYVATKEAYEASDKSWREVLAFVFSMAKEHK